MNRDLKCWKEAATVILASAVRNCFVNKNATSTQTCRPPLLVPKRARNVTQSWLETVVFDYTVLMLQRSAKSSFMPHAQVFPGGTISPSDFSNEWIQMFQPFCKPPNFELGTVRQTAKRPPILAMDRGRLGSEIPGEVAFRICAIRETFEESGILLVKPKAPGKCLKGQGAITLTQYDQKELAKWRLLVQKNAENFISLCRELNCIPNIWALKEWSNWLTPTFLGGKRFDTVFFICCLQEIPFTLHDGYETVQYNWMSPLDFIQGFNLGKFIVPPPQWYELSRLCQIPCFQDLQQFSQDRALEGCEQWFPIHLVASDGYAFLYPGDELYPEDPDYTGEKEININSSKTLEQLRLEVTRLHRIEWRDRYFTLYVNIEPQYKHVHPLTMNMQFNSNL
ncbi:nucleoside diphosphate-linked moiety X motif 19-like [Carcharodon carcharias]|uniref:nucleoside diphosphate-linked moiety X motif 19-like n=1 Tax=Carcharodon carcharias TaxID=13397 RepID=UPI001B7E8C8C|nr:nucleoside diphosphate-linked moiety X motif 19-like [Carcharodon carcharias]XP_041059600.1 nucleoside diphosphate-linked moiety X motif 19-like [Carcharodon carcharias]XP_041059601.1 nucleoside diphosphate-linked moiety X motif 19-like [Carcharodon carcharias]